MSQGVYSYGVEQHDQWSADVRQNFPNAPIYEYDCTVSSSPLASSNVHFHKECVSGAPFVSMAGLQPTNTVGAQLTANHGDLSQLPEG